MFEDSIFSEDRLDKGVNKNNQPMMDACNMAPLKLLLLAALKEVTVAALMCFGDTASLSLTLIFDSGKALENATLVDSNGKKVVVLSPSSLIISSHITLIDSGGITMTTN